MHIYRSNFVLIRYSIWNLKTEQLYLVKFGLKRLVISQLLPRCPGHKSLRMLIGRIHILYRCEDKSETQKHA